MRNFFRNEKGFWGFLSLLLAVMISGALFYWVASVYFSSSVESTSAAHMESALAPSGPKPKKSTTSKTTGQPQTVLQNTVSRIRAVEKQQSDRERDLMQAAGDLSR